MKIMIATGGTGGHIFPALQTAQVLRDKGHEVIFVGVLALARDKIQAQGFEAVLIHAKGFTDRSLLGLLRFNFVMLKAMWQALDILKQKRPDKVIGFGGYSSFAVVLCAWILRIPVMIHEQNVVPGKANRLLSKIVKRIAISFENTKNFLGDQKTVWTGCPCHQQRPSQTREDLLNRFSLDVHKKTVLVLGGSQGSQRLNEVVFDVISSWKPADEIQFIHMTGVKDYQLYLEKYRHTQVRVKVCDFISPIEEAYHISDVAIARAGASTVSELGFFMIPTIFVPYPLADGHQTYNAKILSEVGLARIIEQKDLTIKLLKENLEHFLMISPDKQRLCLQIKRFFKDSAAHDLAQAIESL